VLGQRYRLVRRIGRGGMGAVYEARVDGGYGRVAIKVIDAEHAANDVVAQRFAREARLTSAIGSDHVVTILDAGSDAGRPFLVMELLEGEDLGARLRARKRLSSDETMHIVRQALRALARAHDAGIVHRDLKPENVMLVRRDGDDTFVKLVDFGISKVRETRHGTAALALTKEGTLVGTPLYMAPEQARALPDVDARADLYSVGAIAFECLTGRPPHVGPTYEAIVVKACLEDAADVRQFAPDVPPEVAAFVARALARDRDARFPSAKAMLDAMPKRAAASKDDHAGGPRPGARQKAGEKSRKRDGARARTLAAWVALDAFAVVLGVVVVLVAVFVRRSCAP
jgi:serine/threonine-protein kinase